MEKLEIKICKWKLGAESQRANELKSYGHDKGCEGFYNQGCYACDGYNTKCLAYIPTGGK